jgi:hypothetical protein
MNAILIYYSRSQIFETFYILEGSITYLYGYECGLHSGDQIRIIYRTTRRYTPEDIVAYYLKARIVESQQPAVTRQRPVNNRGMVFSAQSVPMAAHATMEYVMHSLSNNCTATEERCFLRGPCRDVISFRQRVCYVRTMTATVQLKENLWS